MGYTVLNQNNYAGVPYPNSGNPKANIKSSGCGVVSMAMILNNLFGENISVSTMAKYSLSHGARASAGTNMRTLSKAVSADHPHMEYTTTNDEDVLKAHLDSGGMAIMNSDGNDGCTGIFAYGGHYLAILGLRNGKPLIADPAWTASRYKTTYRKKYVEDLSSIQKGLITCDWYVLNMDTKYRSPNYYLFKNTAAVVVAEEEEEFMYKTINEVPEAYRQTIQDLIDDGDLKGNGEEENGFPVINVTETFCKAAVVLGRRNPQYNTINDVPESYRPSIQKLIDMKRLNGEGKMEDGTLILNISEDFCKQVTINDRTGLYD